MDFSGDLAPNTWRYSLFPLSEDTGDIIDLNLVSDMALTLIEEGNDEGVGAVMHWAHILKSEQNANGYWPRFVNARTGEPSGQRLTLLPAGVIETLAELLGTTEFDDAIRRTVEAKSRSTTGDPHDITE